ncbi:MAG: hypothetical protein HYS56_05135 [Candidatus Omnitrophica bacterium]|nr:hypothetical protein [Candidatus Omnitrophota bacterium]
MIPIELSTAVAFYAGVTTTGVLLLWFISLARESRASLPRGNKRHRIWQCRICIHVYQEDPEQILSVCPRCGTYNQREENSD